jgi:hypothetical protein
VLAHDSLGVVAVLGEDQLQDQVMLAVGLQSPARLTQLSRDRPGVGQMVHKHPVVRLEFGVVGAVDEQVVELLGSGSGAGLPAGAVRWVRRSTRTDSRWRITGQMPLNTPGQR